MLRVYVCASLSPCSPGHMPALFLSISVPLLLSAQCLTPESAIGGKHRAYTLHWLLHCSLLFFPFFFFFRSCVNYIKHLCKIEYDPDYLLLTYCTSISCRICNKSSSSFHMLLSSQIGSNLWCYCLSPFQCKQ